MVQQSIIGFVGQGYVGGSYANNFESRGIPVVRYSLEEQYRGNREKIKECDVVFICVPTPTTPKGFDARIVEAGLALVGRGKIAVVKSTLIPGTTRALQKKFPHITVLCSPEFLSVVTAQEDADNPFSNIIGIPKDDDIHRKAAETVLAVLPHAAYASIVLSDQAELIKYAHNLSGYTQILTFNAIYDIAEHYGVAWNAIQEALHADPLISSRYSNPVHKSGRGAGGACFIKDMAAFSRLYRTLLKKRKISAAFLAAAEKNNIALLVRTKKDLALLTGVYGKKILRTKKKQTASAKTKKHNI